jgi:hypothetical protein
MAILSSGKDIQLVLSILLTFILSSSLSGCVTS